MANKMKANKTNTVFDFICKQDEVVKSNTDSSS